MPRNVTEIRVDERGYETHESWVLISAHHVSSSGAHLFDSDIPHQHCVSVEVKRCKRRRDLNHDWLHATKVLMQLTMSQAQWGAFVSSFGQSGVPATLEFLTGEGHVSSAPAESRFDQSHEEVRNAGGEAFRKVKEGYQKVMEAFETGGKRAQREALRSLGFTIQNAPADMEFAAQSLTEHVENVVTKAKADIEGMALAALEAEGAQGAIPQANFPELGRGDNDV